MRTLLSLTLLTLLLALSQTSLADERPPIYHAIEPAFVVNINDGSRPRFMQLKLQVMTREQTVIPHLESHQAAIRHAMIMLLSSQDGDTMRNAAAREPIRAQALAILQQTLAEVSGLQEGLEAVYFTDLIIQ